MDKRRLMWLFCLAGLILLITFQGGVSMAADGKTKADWTVDGKGINVLIDQNHSYAFIANSFPGYLNPHGFQTTSHLATIPPDFGKTYQAMICYMAWGDTPFGSKEIDDIVSFVRNGGGLLLIGNGKVWLARDKDSKRTLSTYPLNTLAQRFGVAFTNETSENPLRAIPGQPATDGIDEVPAPTWVVRPVTGSLLKLLEPEALQVLVKDAKGQPVIVARQFGRGRVVVCSENQIVNADMINERFFNQLVKWAAENAPKAPADTQVPGWILPETEFKVGQFKILYAANRGKEAVDFVTSKLPAIYEGMAKYTNVPPPATEGIEVQIVGGSAGGWTAGPKAIGVCVPPPGKFEGAAGVLAHEFGHNWVGAGPLWVGEVLPTFLGMRVMEEYLGYKDYVAEEWTDSRKKLDEKDPQRNKIDVDNFPGDDPQAVWQKTFWIYEELEKKYGRKIWTKYLTDKRKRGGYYSAHSISPNTSDLILDLSEAAGEDLFGWFKSIGTNCDKSKTGEWTKQREQALKSAK